MKYLLLIILMSFPILSHCQQVKDKSAIIFHNKAHYFFTGTENYFSVLSQQMEEVKLEDLSAKIYYYDEEEQILDITEHNGLFRIHPQHNGFVKITIQVNDTLEIKTIQVKPFPITFRIGNTFNLENITAKELQYAEAIIAEIVNLDINAKCRIDEFEVIRITKKGKTKRANNQGAKFKGKALKLIQKSKKGDIYIFRKIQCTCPGEKISRKEKDIIIELNS